MSEPIYIDRPPRIQPELPFDEIEIPPPPDKDDNSFTQLVQVGLPLITIVGYVLVASVSGSGRSPALLIPMALSVVASTIFSVYTYRQEQQKRAEIERAYSERLVEMNKEMDNFQDMQRRFYRFNYPDCAGTLRIADTTRQEALRPDRILRTEARLWERRTDDDDFGVIRLGMGTMPSTVKYVLAEAENYDDPQIREAMKLSEDSRYVADIPIVINLRQMPEEEDEEKDEEEREDGRPTHSPLTPVTHALGIAGEQTAVYSFARALLAHYVVFHAPMDARLSVLANRRENWSWTDALPHSQDDDQLTYRCFVEEAAENKANRGRFDEDHEGVVTEFLEGVRKILAQRKIRLQEQDDDTTQAEANLPFHLLVVDMLDVLGPDSPLSNLEADAAISILLEEGAALGAAVIFLVPERSKVPSGCQSVIEIEQTSQDTGSGRAKNALYFRYAETGVNSWRYVGEADFIAKAEVMTQLAHLLAAIELRQGFGANLTNKVPFLDLMGYRTLDNLRLSTREKWAASLKQENADWLRVKIGRMSGNKARTLVFSAKRDGVHGMIAGSTGSGKSELLISLIAGMSVTYNPATLNFVLVDYKGGGAFKGFENLPHCVDIITNLEGEGVTRMFTAIQSEMQRRQKLNVDTETKNIVDYRQKGYHLTHAPYPFLFIIIDEFAEMIADRPEYRAELESITRVGRAQGVSLLLAAQRPSGVTDQMRSNIKFRISLRVETPAESREMLRRNDAAFLPSNIPGRGFLQVGNDEIELLQVAYTGDRYVDPGAGFNRPVLWPDRDEAYDPAQDQEPPELYKAIVDLLDNLAAEEEIAKQRAPWPEFLSPSISLSELLVSSDAKAAAITSPEYLAQIDQITLGREPEQILTLNPSVNKWVNGENGWYDDDLDWQQYAMRPVVGLVDNPFNASQLPLVADLRRGHLAVFGASGWGKTTFIRTLVTSLAATHSPSQAHIYLLDLGGRNLGALGELPHVGALIIPDEEGYEERVEQLLREIDTLIDARKDLLNLAGQPDLYRYNERHPDKALPAVLVAIDNFGEFQETFDNGGDGVESILDKFVSLARQSKPYGIHFAITVPRLNALANQVFSIFTERMTLKLGEQTDYRAIIGGQVADLADIPGRGYVKIGRQPLTFQVALPIDLDQADLERGGTENQELTAIARHMREWIESSGRPYAEPVRVDALPKTILFKQILARQHELELDETLLDRLRAIAAENWAASRTAEAADWLKVTMGVISGNRLRELYFAAKEDGVHGMIAGGTGSGKSELLMTLIVGLALDYDPSILNFVLVDYKGGGAFKPFDNLPHVVDSITNLNQAAVIRMFTAIDAEMQRRQKLNADTGTKDIVEYRSKGLHLTHAPYPHLFIIIDEYAEMITDNPDFKEELDSITRVGRAQGVNLLLASQRPTGVSDQMRANIKFRICLRVEGVDTSREMLRRSDAAFLPSGMPGRGYLQIGNENIELMQVAYTGEPYPYAEVKEGGRRPNFYDVIVDLAQELAGENRPRTPWPPFLPSALTFADPLVADYLRPADRERLQVAPGRPPVLNPNLAAWQAGRGSWPGVDWDRTAMRISAGLIDDPYNANLLPLEIDLTRGHAILYGASGWGKTTFLRSLVLSLAATHSPDEAHVHLFDLGGRNLEMLRELPQVGTVIMPDERGYEERVQQLLRELNDLADSRKRLFADSGVSSLYEYNRNHPDAIEPANLVLIDNFNEFIETFGQEGGGEEEDSIMDIFVGLLRQAKAYGIHVLITVDRLNAVSNKLQSLFTERLTLRLSDASTYRAIVGGGADEIEEIPGRGLVRVGRQPLSFQVALPPGTIDEQGRIAREAQAIREIGATMQAFVQQSGRSYREPLRIEALPQTSSFRQVLAEELEISPEQTFLPELKGATARVWGQNDSAEEADWLKVILGITSGNRKRLLEFEAKKDGVHGMIAGGTGSGKSELLMTMIVGLALNYSPDILNFVLVDYKGGGAFAPFRQLPHCVDIVTNLNKSAVNRMFTAINAEMRRRQALNAETGTKDIVEYRRKGLHKTHAPYPHLFVIIDEFSEMIDDNPEYRAELDSITRVGRAQGVNLILASQRPKGVSDQMRANIKLRLCLRVEELDTSREMLRRPDAALLPNGLPGRGYLQIGNEKLELIQVSWTGEKMPDLSEEPVLWPDHETAALVDVEAGDVPKLFDQVVRICSELYGGGMAPKPWPNFLPDQISLQTPLFDAQQNRTFTLTTAVSNWLNGETAGLWPGVDWRREALRPVVGLLDNPAEATQEPLRFELQRYHLAVMGDSGWGKTTFLRTLMVSLAAHHAPDELHLYVLDLGGRNFRPLEDLPHLGGVIYADEEAYEERLQRLLDKLNRLVDERSQLFSNADANSLIDYNSRFPKEALPAVVVLIDNVTELRENYEMLLDSTLIPLIRRSLSAGVTFVVTGNAPTSMPGKMYNLFGERITFKQGNPERYMDIVGRGAIEIDDIPGRGYIRAGRRPLLFHMAQPVGLFDGPDQLDTLGEGDELRRLAQHMRDHLAQDSRWGSHRPESIDILPEIVPLAAVLEAGGPVVENRVQALAGMNASLLPAVFDLERAGPHFAVVGPPLSGKTTALYSWLFSLAERYPPERVQIVLIDVQRRFEDYGGRRRIGEIPHLLAAVSELDEIEKVTEQLKNEGPLLAAGEQKRDLFVIIDNFDDFTEEISNSRTVGNDLALLARRYGRDGLHFVVAGMLDSGINELRRRVLSSNYGIGLKNGQALDTLRVSVRPAALRGKELPTGRGFIVRSGQTTMVQVASPFDGLDLGEGEGNGDDQERLVWALDHWVDRITAQHAGPAASWSDGSQFAAGGPQPAAVDEGLQRMLNLLRRIVVKRANGQEGEIPLEALDNKEVLMTFIREALREESNLDPSFFGTTDDEIITATEGYFPQVKDNV